MTVSLASSNTDPASRGLVELAHADPGRALATVGRIDLDTLDATEAASVCWAAGLAHRELGDLDAAERFLQRAISVAEDPELEALITSSLALVHLGRGDLTQALGMVEWAAEHISGLAWARNEMQRGLVLQRQGDLVGALEAYRRAEPGLSEDRATLVRLLNNRALAASYRGDHEGGAADLARAYALAVADGQHLSAASCAANLGFTLGRLGDVASALDWFSRAEEVFDELGVADTRRAVLALDRAEVAAHAGLLAEARRDATEASRGLAEAGSLVDAAEADLLAARMALAANDHQAAARLGGTARRLFEAQGRDSWSVQARFVEVTARSELGLSGAEESLSLIKDLERLGWQLEAAQARVAAAAALIRQGKMSRARRLLAEHDAGRSEPAVLRAQRWHARSLLAVSDGDVGAARRALRSGLAVLDEHRSVLGSPELRAHASTIGRDLIVRAVQLAVDSGRPWSLLATVESWRAASLHLPPVHRPEDATLAADLTALRQIDGEIRATPGGDVAGLLVRRARLEDRVRRASHGVRGVAETRDRIDRGRVVEALAGRTLVAFLRDRGRLRAVSVRDGAVRSHDLGDADPVADEVRSLVFSLHRMASGSGSPGARQATA
ncbi:MAG: tetratricopeptide repeat protein, partial [Acidimicrobiia bacterium]